MLSLVLASLPENKRKFTRKQKKKKGRYVGEDFVFFSVFFGGKEGGECGEEEERGGDSGEVCDDDEDHVWAVSHLFLFGYVWFRVCVVFFSWWFGLCSF